METLTSTPPKAIRQIFSQFENSNESPNLLLITPEKRLSPKIKNNENLNRENSSEKNKKLVPIPQPEKPEFEKFIKKSTPKKIERSKTPVKKSIKKLKKKSTKVMKIFKINFEFLLIEKEKAS